MATATVRRTMHNAPDGAARRFPEKPRFPAWLVLKGAVLLVAGALAFVLTLPFATSGASSVGGFQTAQSIARTAARLIRPDSSPADFAQAQALSLAALRRSPGDVVALRTLGLVADEQGKVRFAGQIFSTVERLSRRDLATQLWMIEDRVRQGDVRGALRHYDIAMRTSLDARKLLAPVIAQASNDGAIAQAVAGRMAKRPDWWPAVFDAMIASAPAAAVLNVADQMRLRPADPIEGWRLSAALRKIADAGDAGAALRLYSKIAPQAARAPLRAPGFDDDAGLAPFAWALTDQYGAAAVRERREGAQGVASLSLIARPGGGGLLARQLMALAPGRYAMSLRAGALSATPTAAPIITVRCAGSAPIALLLDDPIRTSPSRFAFSVPAAGCAGQWFDISRQPGDSDDADNPPWIDSIRVIAL